MGTEAIGKSSSPVSVYGDSSAVFTSGVTLMSPNDIIAYVTRALGNIGDQLNDYKNMVKEREQRAKDLRDALAQVRSMGTEDFKNNPAKFNEVMTTLEALKDQNPAIQKVYDQFQASYGSYTNTNTGEVKPGTGNQQDSLLSSNELQNQVKVLEDGLQSLNSDNELVMMNLQQLMQQRNQVSQFASNTLNMSHETAKGIIGNFR